MWLISDLFLCALMYLEDNSYLTAAPFIFQNLWWYASIHNAMWIYCSKTLTSTSWVLFTDEHQMHSHAKVIKIMTNDSFQFLSAQHHSRFCLSGTPSPFSYWEQQGREVPTWFWRVFCPASQILQKEQLPFTSWRDNETQLKNWKRPKMGFLWSPLPFRCTYLQ